MIKLTAGTSSIILPLHDTNGELQAWIDRHYATDLMRIMAPPSGIYTRRGSNLPFPNYAPLPAPKINQLVLPTGASRWGYTLLLATEEQKEEIYTAQNSDGLMTLHWSAPLVGDLGPTGQPLNEADSETNRTVKLLVHCLPPRPVTPRGRLQDNGETSVFGVSRRIENLEGAGYPQASDLFVIPVVDVRYFLQFLDTASMSAEDFTSDAGPHTDTFNGGAQTSAEKIYEYLIGRIPSGFAGELDGFVVCDDISPQYTTPPNFTTENDYENLGVVLDAFCWSHGLAFVPNITQVYKPTAATTETYAYGIVSVDESNVIYRGIGSNFGAIRGYASLGVSVRSTATSPVDKSPAETFSSHTGSKSFCGLPLLLSGGDTYRRCISGLRTMEGTPLPAEIQIQNDGAWEIQPPPDSFLRWPSRSDGSTVIKAMGDTRVTIRTEWILPLSEPELKQIARDYYYRLLWQFDYTFLGVQPWQQSAYDDVAVYSMEHCNGSYVCQTRVTSIPINMIADPVAVSNGSGQQSSGACTCTCIANGDMTLHGVETSSLWLISFSKPQVFEQLNGSITLPAGGYTVAWSNVASKWVLDVSASLTAAYADGSDATAATTMDAELTLEWAGPGESPILKLCVDGTVPAP